MTFLALVIVLVSGLIAYVGDLVGRKLGRKRLTLFGLRPRYTAIVISVGVGMVIALLTITAVFAVSKHIRDAFLTPIDLLKAQRDDFQRERDKYQLERNDFKNQRDEKRRELEKTSVTLSLTKQHLQSTEKDLAHSNHQRQLIDAQLQKAKNDLASVTNRLKETKTRLDENIQQLASSTTEIKRKTDEYQKLSDTTRALEQQAIILEERIQFLSILTQPAFAHLSFLVGQEILTGTVSTTLTENGRIAWFKSFLAAADKIVRQRNAKLPKNLPALVFITGFNVDPPKPEKVEENEAIAILSKRVAAMAANEVIVRLVPVNNVVIDNPALINIDSLMLYENDLQFGPGEAVAHISFTVDDQTTLAQIVSRLVDDLLQGAVPAALREKGMIFISRRFDPNHTERIPEPSLSLVPWADILTAAEKARSHPGKVEVIARTKEALRRADPLNLTFEVSSAK
ncbi:MAG: DUF3084 domain-containing protein [Armatimonadota bacterium]